MEIERCTKRKPFIGGFKHRVTGSEFHNASAQTLPKPKPATGKVCVYAAGCIDRVANFDKIMSIEHSTLRHLQSHGPLTEHNY